MEDKNFLQGYEVSGIQVNRRMYKIIAASIVLTVAPLFGLAQSNLLSSSACESPFVSNVCQVLDTVYVGAKMLAQTPDGGYQDIPDYDRLSLEDAKVIWTEHVKEEPPLEYPEGYFQLANPEMFLDDQDQTVAFNSPAPFTPTTVAPPVNRPNRVRPPLARSRRKSSTKPVLPKANKNAIKGNIGDDPLGLGDLTASNANDGKKPEVGKKPEKVPTPSPKPKNDIEKKTAKSSDVAVDSYNRAPIKALGEKALKSLDEKTLKLSDNFSVKMKGKIDDKGMLIRDTFSFEGTSGVPEQGNIVELVQTAMLEVGRTGFLRHLSDQGVADVEMTFVQDDKAMFADLRSVYGNEKKAKSVASALRIAISVAKRLRANSAKQSHQDELALLKAANVTSDGKFLVINFNMEKPAVQSMLDARLKKFRADLEKEKKEGAKSNGAVSNNASESKDAK